MKHGGNCEGVLVYDNLYNIAKGLNVSQEGF